MPSITDKLKKTKHVFKKFVANCTKSKSAWEQDPDTLERLGSFVDRVLEGGVDPLIEVWNEEPIDESLMPMSVATGLIDNRFKNVGCLEATRVPLELDVLTDTKRNRYIHANFINTPKTKKKFITTQSPSGSTWLEFWNMVIEQGVEIIVGLTPVNRYQGLETVLYRDIEGKERIQERNWDLYKGLSSCARYFPQDVCIHRLADRDKNTLDVECVDMFEHEYELNGKKMIIIERILEIDYDDGENTHTVRHFHWVWNQPLTKEWHSIPMQFLQDLPKTEKPIVLQCESGSHLSSAFVMCQYYLDLLEMGRKVKPPTDYLLELRAQCHNAFSKWYIWVWVHMVLMQFFMEKTGKHHLRLKQFKRDYQELMKKPVFAGEDRILDEWDD